MFSARRKAVVREPHSRASFVVVVVLAAINTGRLGWKTFLVIPELAHELDVWHHNRELFTQLQKCTDSLQKLHKVCVSRLPLLPVEH